MATVSPEPSAPANEGDDARRLPKVLLTDPFLAIEVEGFRRLLPGATLAVCTSYDDTEFARLAADADVLVTTLRRIDAETLAMAPRARFIQQFGVGYDPIDLTAINAAGIAAAYNPGVNAAAVAEHTVMLMLALVKDLAWSERWARQGQFMLDEMPAAGIGDLAGATVGLIGLGAMGQAVAERLRAPFGCRYRLPHSVSSPRASLRSASGRDMAAAARAMSGLGQVVSLHAPLTSATHRMMGDTAGFAAMPRDGTWSTPGVAGWSTKRPCARAIESGDLGGAGARRHRGRAGRPQPVRRPPRVLGHATPRRRAAAGSTARMVERSAEPTSAASWRGSRYATHARDWPAPGPDRRLSRSSAMHATRKIASRRSGPFLAGDRPQGGGARRLLQWRRAERAVR